MIPILRREMVSGKEWFSDEEMIDIIAVCQGMPGVIAINMATYVGFKRRGLLGSLVATVGVVLPSYVIILVIARFMEAFQSNLYIAGALSGLRAAALGMVLLAVWQVGSSVIKSKRIAAAAVLSFLLLVAVKVDVAYVILAYLLAGAIYAYVKDRSEGRLQGGVSEKDDGEEGES